MTYYARIMTRKEGLPEREAFLAGHLPTYS
jgi:hypothetical protein